LSIGIQKFIEIGNFHINLQGSKPSQAISKSCRATVRIIAKELLA
jgi:hypothetical protein